MALIKILIQILSVIITAYYLYRFIFVAIAMIFKEKKLKRPVKNHSIAILICARNEEKVLGDLLDSIKRQTYQNYQIFVLADNCEDHTGFIAANKGANLYYRRNYEQIGKGYALQYLLNKIKRDYPLGFDAYLILDADNILANDYLEQLNKTFSQGNDIVCSYLNNKNYADNWISASSSLWLLIKSKFLNYPRYLLGLSAMASGTGLLFSKKIAEQIKDWPYHLLAEDNQFCIDQIIKGNKIAYCNEAIIYDEQPTSFEQSFKQRLRWTKGIIQVYSKYYKTMINQTLCGDFSCLDILMNQIIIYIITVLYFILKAIITIYYSPMYINHWYIFHAIIQVLVKGYLGLLTTGLLITISEWKRINAPLFKKLIYPFAYPIFIFSYLPISIKALFSKVEWEVIEHKCSLRKTI